MEIDELNESVLVNAADIEVILKDEEGSADEANAMVPEVAVQQIQMIVKQLERYKPEPEPEQQQQSSAVSSSAASEADSDDFRLKQSH
eukprot:3941225-Rhodomonas_salina.2